MPDHHLHAYFKYLVDHQDLLTGVNEDGNPPVDKNRSQGLDQTGGALSLLGSVYGSGEDEDGTTDNTRGFEKNECEVVVDAVSSHDSAEKEQAESSLDIARKVGSISKKPISLEEKVPVIKRNQSISTVKAAIAARAKASDALDSMSNAADKSQTSVPNTAKFELPVVEPPSDLKGIIEKVVEFILKNGKQFEAVLAEQDRPHGRFPFLVPSNRYHTYYLKVLQNPEESKLPGKGFQKHSPAVREGDNNTNVHEESDNLSFGSVGSDLPCDMDRKEKFKMIIGKSKKDSQDPTPKDSQPQNTICMDAAAAAAILQAATRGIRNPSIEIFTKASSGNSQGPGSYVKSPSPNAEDSASVHVDKTTVEKVDIAVAGEADSSEAHMTKEQRLKAERLKRAKMFAAMIKNRAEPFKREVSRGLSVEPPGYGLSSSDAETGNLAGKEREGSSAPLDVDNSDKKSEDKHSADNSDKSHKSEEKLAADNDERRSKRKYRSRSSRHEEEAEEEEEEESREDKRDHKRSKKKHRSHRSSHSSRDRHSHKRRHSSSKEDKYSYKRIKHDSSSDDEPHHSRHHRKYDSSSGEKHHTSRRQHRENSMSDDERRHSRHRHKHHSSSDDEHEHRHRSIKHKSRSHAERETDLEEGEINMKSDKSKASKAGHVSREASVELSKSNLNANATSQSPETTDVSDELRAKIRAMLMANL
ncbi:hypothetical protein RIF29_18018 [Crotalaria pallida]|uniref:SURP motif domain-containing protein n=1 Tax=Crotalaria pallida TaxID=3830 RepID=A0AAN9FI77_CROPI